MHYLPLVNTKRVAFRHRVGDVYEKESDNALPCVGPVAWRAGRPFTRIGRAKRVGRPALQVTGLLTEDSPVAAYGNAFFVRRLSRHNSEEFQILSITCTGYQRYMPNTYFSLYRCFSG